MVTGIEIRWISTRANPIGIPAKPVAAPFEVVPTMMTRKKKWIMTSTFERKKVVGKLLLNVPSLASLDLDLERRLALVAVMMIVAVVAVVVVDVADRKTLRVLGTGPDYMHHEVED